MSFTAYPSRHLLLLGSLILLGTVAFAATNRPRRIIVRPSNEEIMRTIKEEELSHWKPTQENNAVPDSNLRCVVSDLSGTWKRSSGFDHATFKMFAIGPGVYQVYFSTGGCLGSWTLERIAMYQNGILMLDRPVSEYCLSNYNRLFTLRTPQGIRLISDSALSSYREFNPGHLALSDPIFAFANTTHTLKVEPRAKTAPAQQQGIPVN